MSENPHWGDLDLEPVDKSPAPSEGEVDSPYLPPPAAGEFSSASESLGVFDGAAGVLDDDPLQEGQAPLELAIEPETFREISTRHPNSFRGGLAQPRPSSAASESPYPTPRGGWHGDIRYFLSVCALRRSLQNEVRFRTKRSAESENHFHESLVRLGRKVVSSGWPIEVNEELKDRVESALNTAKDSRETSHQATESETAELQAFRDKIEDHRREAEQVALREAPLLAQTEADAKELKRAKLALQRAEIEFRNLAQSDDPQDIANELNSQIRELREKRDAASRTLEVSREALGECRRRQAVAEGQAETLSEKMAQQTKENQRMHGAREEAQLKIDHELSSALADVGREAWTEDPPPSLRDECTSAKAAHARWDEATRARESQLLQLASYDVDTFRRGGLLTAGIVTIAVGLPLLILIL